MLAKVLIVDDHPVLANGLKMLLEASQKVEVAGIANCGAKCMDFLLFNGVDIVLLDINLPDANGIELCDQIRKEYPATKVIAVSSFNEFSCIHQMLENGASGYIVKNASTDEFLTGIESVMEGETYLSKEVASVYKKQVETHIYLTPREKSMLKLIVEGYTNQEIAEKCFLGHETVNTYRKNLLYKLNAKNTACLVKIAIEKMLV